MKQARDPPPPFSVDRVVFLSPYVSFHQVSQSEIPQLFGCRASTLGNYQRQEGVLKGGAAKPRVFSMQKLVEVRERRGLFLFLDRSGSAAVSLLL